jgi:hypothetical protein
VGADSPSAVSVDIAGIDVVVGGRMSPSRRLLPTRTPALPEQVRTLVVRELVAQLRLPYARERARLVVAPDVADDAGSRWGAVDDDPILLLGGLRADLVVPAVDREGAVWIGDGASPDARRTAIPARTALPRALRRIAASSSVESDDPGVLLIARALGVPTGAAVPTPWNPYPLLESFPARLWGGDADPTMIAAIGWRARLAHETPTDARATPPSSDGGPER